MCKMYICKDMRLLCLVVILSGTLANSKENGSIGQGTNTSKLNMFSLYQGQIRNAFEMRRSPFRIVNGSRARTGEFRSLVSLQWTDGPCEFQSKPCHQCGGALLTRTGIFLSTTFALTTEMTEIVEFFFLFFQNIKGEILDFFKKKCFLNSEMIGLCISMPLGRI